VAEGSSVDRRRRARAKAAARRLKQKLQAVNRGAGVWLVVRPARSGVDLRAVVPACARRRLPAVAPWLRCAAKGGGG
jgi:hypothetical protein